MSKVQDFGKFVLSPIDCVVKGQFSIIPVKFHGKTFGSHNMTALYPNPCYKGTVLYVPKSHVLACL